FCAGGTLGLEAISRGASSCYLVENGGKALSVLKRNIDKLDVSERCYTISMNALSSISVLEDKGVRFDLLFADPPYKKPLALPLLTKLSKSSILNEDAILILEVSSRDELVLPDSISILKTWKSGDTALYFISFDNH
ncbi:MAG: hypothetical protein GF315_11760, partial [candidate division Zixibacteria bacterium]|nr:hypothetical protein [candidate division Zixibacteria bacterium]